MNRRSFIRTLPLALSGVLAALRRPSFAQAPGGSVWSTRQVLPGDEDQLVDLMRSCVNSGDAFYGLCNEMEWTRGWAEGVVADRPRSMVITLEEDLVAYHDLPTKEVRTFGEPTIDHFRKSFWCGAAGVRMDLLGREAALTVFRHLLYRVYAEATALGYEFVRAAAPWEQHPYLAKPFADYPGLSSTEFVDDEGATKYLLEWRLEDAMVALEEEGAGVELG